ncbi:MAG: U32 family peptidase, partial [Candidatus Hermodarchaeota archaeon]
MKKVELLAPAKNFKAIIGASKYADSIYFGLNRLNMRMRSENFDVRDLNKIVGFCHKNRLKTYLTT